jgi:hypothetical protein
MSIRAQSLAARLESIGGRFTLAAPQMDIRARGDY